AFHHLRLLLLVIFSAILAGKPAAISSLENRETWGTALSPDNAPDTRSLHSTVAVAAVPVGMTVFGLEGLIHLPSGGLLGASCFRLLNFQNGPQGPFEEVAKRS